MRLFLRSKIQGNVSNVHQFTVRGEKKLLLALFSLQTFTNDDLLVCFHTILEETLVSGLQSQTLRPPGSAP